MISIEVALLILSLLLLISIYASKISDRVGVPALLLFLVIGMLAGSDGIGGLAFTDARLAQNIGVVALAIILFSGGLDTEWNSIRPVMKEAIPLALVGVAFTAVVMGVAAYFLTDFTLLEGMLLGSIVSSTDAAAVFSILRSKGVHLKPKIRALLELESGSNDPMAVFLTIGMVQLLTLP
ncbi:MAG TPA: cation:proton antiporter, partial [Anaerolineaceae bacterium]|nr:cation:proton antiporter [Anaerolineaceae bacterium]